MIAQISTGEGFGGLVNYANDIIKKDTVIIASDGVNLSSNATITASFKAQAKARPTIQKFVGHISLSFSPDDQEKLDDEKIAEIAKEYMRRMGIVNTQYVIFRHFDQPHPHIHIVYNRVDNDGNGIKGDTSYTKSAAITKALTREYGLTFGKGKDKVRRERLKGKDAIKYRLFDNITAAVKESVTWDELRKLLAAKGISLDFVKDKDGNIRGVTFTDSKRNVTFAGSKIDRSLSFANIDRQMYNVIHVDDHQDDDTLRLHQEQEKPFDINDAFDFFADAQQHVSLMSGGTRQPSEDAVEQLATPSDGASSGSGIGEAIVDVLLQPNVAPVSAGGGGGASGGWRDDDDDDEKNKNSYKPRKRR
ncbi:MAG: relaxase/mobilization nuclease domain-containing protein [Prevotella sp.]|nr:relaxase/mobilization nuclease domain-containing protein [Prevotella sp.]